MLRQALLLVASSYSLSAEVASNGIMIEKGKIFDNRSLVLMTDQLEKRLQSINTVDQASLSRAIGAVSGYRGEDVSRSFSIGSLPASVNVERGSTTAGGITATPTVVTPQAPALADLPNTQFKLPDFGLNSQDLLTEQINLNYQIFNLRMLLERSLSDRLINGEARLQVVVGFQISIDPPKGKDGHAAYAQLNLSYPGQAPSLVAALPQEKTYNVAALSREANAFGGAAVVKIVTVGYSERRRGERYFLYQDSDTEVFQKPGSNELILGWSFRPVLGRKSVAPGIRQVFAVISLPHPASGISPPPLTVSSSTYWRKYDSRKLTLKSERDTVPTDKYPISLISPGVAENSLSPTIQDVKWAVTGDKNAVIMVKGANFFTGTKVLIGGKSLDETAGLQLKSDSALQIETTLDAILTTDAVLNGRYGPSKPLEARATGGIEISAVDPRPWLGTDVVNVALRISAPNQASLQVNDVIDKSTPIISLGGKFFWNIPPENATCFKDNNNKKAFPCVKYEIGVPASVVAAASDLVIRWPFLGPLWTARARISATPTDLKASFLGTIGTKKRLAVTGTSLTEEWGLIADRHYDVKTGLKISPSGSFMFLDIDESAIKSLESIIVLGPEPLDAFVLPLPKAKPDPVAVSFDKPSSPASVAVNYSSTIEFTGKGFSRIRSARFASDTLTHAVKNDKLTIALTRKVTEKPGMVSLTFVLDDDSRVFTEFEVK